MSSEASLAQLQPKARLLAAEMTYSRIDRLFSQAGIEMLLLKGPHLAFTVYDDPQERDFSDLDLLVRPKNFRAAAGILVANGFALSGCDAMHVATYMHQSEWTFSAKNGVAIDLHRGLGDALWFADRISEVFAGKRLFRFGATPAWGMSEEDLLIHLCRHIGSSCFQAIDDKHFIDIDRLVRRSEIDWPLFLQKAAQARTRVVCHFCLEIARIRFATPIPAAAAKMLRPRYWRRRWLQRYLDPQLHPPYRFPGHDRRQVRMRLLIPMLDRSALVGLIFLRFAFFRLCDRFLQIPFFRRLLLGTNPSGECFAAVWKDF